MAQTKASVFDRIEHHNLPAWDDFYEGDFPSYFISDSDLDDCLDNAFEATRTRLGIQETTEELLQKDIGRFLHYIQSVVGDDEHTTTDSAMLGPAIIGFGPAINGVLISWKDTGISKTIGNYAEGWILTPPTAEASFESVNRRHAHQGVPFVLDPVKLKLLSPVRKHSALDDTDLESKIIHLSEIAGWTDKSWFTYDYHQMALILANVIFDFEDSRSFPYLFKTEGGCGGAPPYGNLDTVYSALHFYTRGKTHRAIIGVMNESVQINLGSMKPSDSFFIRSSHLANLGDPTWLKYESAYRSLISGNDLTSGEAQELLRATEGTTLPDEYLQYATEVSPDSYTVGSTISQLRKDGYIMSELDVKVAHDAKTRELALMGTEPIGDLKRRQEEEWKLFKGNHLRILAEISSRSSLIRKDLSEKLMLFPTTPGLEFRDILYSYYRLRTESHSTYSSFFYTDTIRLFKRADIEDLLTRPSRGLRQDFALTESFPKWRKKFLEENFEEKKRKDAITSWLDSGPLDEILSKTLPPGIGTDDARIARSIVDTVSEHNLNKYEAIVVLLFSGDRQLARTTSLLVKQFVTTKFILGQVDKAGYTAICLEGVTEYRRLYDEGGLDKNGMPKIRVRPRERDVTYYNYLLKRKWWLPSDAISQLLKTEDRHFLYGRRNYVFHIEYDYPNMERGLDLIRYEARTNTIREYGGGFLERRTLQGFGRDYCWSAEEYEAIASWPDFLMRESRRYYRRPKYFKANGIYVVNPLSPRTYNRVDQWRRNTFPGILEPIPIMDQG